MSFLSKDPNPRGVMDCGVRRWLVEVPQWTPSEDRLGFLTSLLPPDEQLAITRIWLPGGRVDVVGYMEGYTSLRSMEDILEAGVVLWFARLWRYVKFEDRKRVLISRWLQYSLVHETLGIPFDKIIISRTAEGKPYLKNEEKLFFPNFNFSVSHHGDYVGISSEPVCLVGMDIVSISKPQKESALEFVKNFSSYFTALEWKNILHASSSNETLAGFYRYWSLKEAYVKAIGAGLGFGLQRLEFHHTNWTNISVRVDGVEYEDWRFWLFALDGKHLVSVAKGHPRGAIESYKTTLTTVDFDLDDYQCALNLPEPGFMLCTVEQLMAEDKSRA